MERHILTLIFVLAMAVAANSQITLTDSMYRVYDGQGNPVTLDAIVKALSDSDAIFLGEQHDDPVAHAIEAELFRRAVSTYSPQRKVALSMEMFERDVQPVLDQYLAGAITEEQFLKESRPWPRYATDYRPIIEFARTHHIPVIASDVPRRIATEVSKSGLAAVDELGADRQLAARELQCPTSGDYYERFLQAMGGHPPSGDPKAADVRQRNDRFYLAQCLKDETMGESIADAFSRTLSQHATIVHFNGAFHSDYAEGTAATTRRRMPGRRIAVVSVVPVEDLDRERPDEDDLKVGDYLLYTLKGGGV